MTRLLLVAATSLLFLAGCPGSHSDDAGADTPGTDAPLLDVPGADTPPGLDTPILLPDVPLVDVPVDDVPPPDAPPPVDAPTDAPPPEACMTPGAIEDVACGRCGLANRFCTAARVWEYAPCVEPADAECAPGETGTVACGSMCGTQSARCDTMCHFVPFGMCTETGTCLPGATERDTAGCPMGESRGRSCTAMCAWGPYSACRGAPTDFDGDGSAYDVDCDDTDPDVRVGSTEACGDFVCGATSRSGLRTCTGPGWSVCARPCPDTVPCRAGATEFRSCPTLGCSGPDELRTCTAGGVWSAWSGCAAPTPRPPMCAPVFVSACGACSEGGIYSICDSSCTTTMSACAGAGCIPGTTRRDLTGCPAGQFRETVCDAACVPGASSACMSFPPLVDIMLLVDVTGSHTSVVMANAAILASELAGGVLMDADVRVGVAAFADFPESFYGSAPDQPFIARLVPTSDAMMVSSALTSLPFLGGGDFPESGLQALFELAGGASHRHSAPFVCPAGLAAGGCWRPGAQRAVVMITDITQHNAPHPALGGALVDPYVGFTPLPPVWSTVRTQLISADVGLFAIVPDSSFGADSDPGPQLRLLTSELGQDPTDSVATYPSGTTDWTGVSRRMAMMLARYLGLM